MSMGIVLSEHNDNIPSIMRLDRPPEGFDEVGAALAQGDEQNLVAVLVDHFVEPTSKSYQVRGR